MQAQIPDAYDSSPRSNNGTEQQFDYENTNEQFQETSLRPPPTFAIELTGGTKLYNEGYTGKGIKVAVIDSGIDETHTGFNGKVIKGKDVDLESLKCHGTHVAGTIQ